MSYFDPKIYNIQNLKKEDQKEINFWRELVHNEAENFIFDAEISRKTENDTLKKIHAEITDQIMTDFLKNFEYKVVDVIVSMIDGYSDDVKVIERPKIQSPGGLEEWDEANRKNEPKQ